jgi:hypothetical protein
LERKNKSKPVFPSGYQENGLVSSQLPNLTQVLMWRECELLQETVEIAGSLMDRKCGLPTLLWVMWDLFMPTPIVRKNIKG